MRPTELSKNRFSITSRSSLVVVSALTTAADISRSKQQAWTAGLTLAGVEPKRGRESALDSDSSIVAESTDPRIFAKAVGFLLVVARNSR